MHTTRADTPCSGTIEVTVTAGTGKLRAAGGVTGPTRESIGRAFTYLLSKKVELGLARDLGLSFVPAQALADALESRQVRQIDAGQLGGRWFFNVAGLGLDAHAAAASQTARRGRTAPPG